MTEEKNLFNNEDVIEYNNKVDIETIIKTENNTETEDSNIVENENIITNCLALTIRKEYKLVAVKNVFLKSIRMSWKVILSTIALNILKIFG